MSQLNQSPMLSLLLALIGSASAANLNISCPSGSSWSFDSASSTVSCVAGSTPPPATCAPGTHGTPPNCIPDTPPPTNDLSNCSNQGFSVVGGAAVGLAWGQPGTLYHSSNYGNFGDNLWWVFQMSVSSNTPATQTLGQFNGGEDHSSSPTSRQAVMSTLPCDTRPVDYTGANGPLSVVNGNNVLLLYGVCTPSPFGGTACLAPGKTYYMSTRNWVITSGWQGWSCGQPNCPMFMQVNPAQP